MNFQNFDVYFLHLDWNHLFDVSIIKIRPIHMFFVALSCFQNVLYLMRLIHCHVLRYLNCC